MRTEVDASAARIKKKKRSSERSKRHDRPAEDAEWKQFTSPDGHAYYYNAVTKESRWELPTQAQEPPERHRHRRAKGSSKKIVLEQDTPVDEDSAGIKAEKEKKKRPESRSSVKEESSEAPKAKNAMFQKLQASLEGRLGAMNGPMMGRPPPMLNIRRDDSAGGATGQVVEAKTPSLEEQYEAETAGMSAAERLRFLRKKRQENMIAKRESITGDDFMAEVANNMKKKGATLKSKEKDLGNSDKSLSWKEQEEAEEERKRLQMQADMEAKEQEAARKEREEQAAKEREQRREQERAEHLALEERREQQRRQRQEEEDRRRLEKEEQKRKKNEKKHSSKHLETRDSEHDTIVGSELDSIGQTTAESSGDLHEEGSNASSPRPVNHRSRSRSRGSKRGSSTHSLQYQSPVELERTEGGHLPTESVRSTASAEVTDDELQDEKQRAREERRARKLREKELAASKLTESATSESQRRTSVSSPDEGPNTGTASNIKAEEEARAIEKQLRRERRRVAKLEAALAAQSLGSRDNDGVQHERSQGGNREQHTTDINGSIPGSAHLGGYPGSGQNPPFSGGMYAPYLPYMTMPPPPPPPPTPYGYYYPYMQPPPMMYPPGMVGVPPGYQLMNQAPPPSTDGMTTPSAMVPYSTESTAESVYGTTFGSMYGQQPVPELSRCDCCHGIGVGLVEKNGVCAHCNRLRLAFIIDSAQMRQRCSVCGGWGFQLLQANGMCEHCTRQIAQKSKNLVADGRRRSSVATPLTTRAPVPAYASPPKNNAQDDIEWDKSSSDDSDWDD
ncbi:unnamed protein product [Phytophthora fragariaefolia]|uniref:Unnamed protein product n=1 Tax=Phytophthora fragariaefolia TaxID=1490495 RepID=A0A9W7D003_9STRA|nr:unnamed protein product [Phytophthora fragariaefolia]